MRRQGSFARIWPASEHDTQKPPAPGEGRWRRNRSSAAAAVIAAAAAAVGVFAAAVAAAAAGKENDDKNYPDPAVSRISTEHKGVLSPRNVIRLPGCAADLKRGP